ncbi:hypothetical protein D3C83_227030 [compost metagenome]
MNRLAGTEMVNMGGNKDVLAAQRRDRCGQRAQYVIRNQPGFFEIDLGTNSAFYRKLWKRAFLPV